MGTRSTSVSAKIYILLQVVLWASQSTAPPPPGRRRPVAPFKPIPSIEQPPPAIAESIPARRPPWQPTPAEAEAIPTLSPAQPFEESSQAEAEAIPTLSPAQPFEESSQAGAGPIPAPLPSELPAPIESQPTSPPPQIPPPPPTTGQPPSSPLSPPSLPLLPPTGQVSPTGGPTAPTPIPLSTEQLSPAGSTPVPTPPPPLLNQNPLLNGVDSRLRSRLGVGVVPQRSEGCNTRECHALYASADVFYWPPPTSNTDCLSTLTARPPLPEMPDIDMRPNMVYVVYPDPIIYDGCGNTADGGGNFPTTETYAYDELSTLQAVDDGPPVTQAFNFADLPCPPASIAGQLAPGSPYFPALVAPFKYMHPVEGSNGSINLECSIPSIHDPPVPVQFRERFTDGDDIGLPPK